MGTSSLYGGPKKKALLPSDYDPEGNSEQEIPTGNTIEETEPAEGNPEGITPSKEQSELEKPEEVAGARLIQPSFSWGTARRSMRKAMNNRSDANVKSAIRDYTKALGGHTNAMRQAEKVRNTASTLYNFLSGSPDAISKRLEDAGIRFEGRPTKEVFNDICNLIAPVPNDLEDSLTNMALQETFADVAADQSIDLSQLKNYNEELLQYLVGGLMKHYIFDKLILQSEQTALKYCKNTTDLRNLEITIKQYIDGIVDSIVPDLIKSGLNPVDFNRALETLCDISYQQMEELR